jgi:hypothetical protein
MASDLEYSNFRLKRVQEESDAKDTHYQLVTKILETGSSPQMPAPYLIPELHERIKIYENE